jgi:DNA repair protein RadD
VLDYGGNIARHCPDGDIFRPEIEAAYQKAGEGTIDAKCEWCGFTNLFTPRPNDLEMGIDEHGYFIDETGERVTQDVYTGKDDGEEAETKAVPIPAHYGRRCTGSVITRNAIERCGYFWTCKQCPDCSHENDIAARYCQKCKAELVNPNEKLQLKKEQIEAEYRAYKRDLSQPQTEAVLTMSVHPTVSQSGKPMLRVMFQTTELAFFVFLMTNTLSQDPFNAYRLFSICTDDGKNMPKAITYRKEKNGFFRVIGYNASTTDADLLMRRLKELEKK